MEYDGYLSCRFRVLDECGYNAGRMKFQLEFENGEVLRLKLYEHLKV